MPNAAPPSSSEAVARRAPTAAARLSRPGSVRQRIGLVAGPAVAAVMLLVSPPDGLEVAAWRTAAVGLWMAIWWMSEALPIAATSLLPMVTFPLLGVAPIRDAAAPFANPLIFLFLGGFLIALALEDVGLHRRIALGILTAVGSSRRRVVFGFMLASAFLSLWISNTATAMMMMPIALSVITQMPRAAGDGAGETDDGHFSLALLLGVAYACSVGGAATLIGTPTNALLAGYLLETYGYDISFAAWMSIGLPVAAVGLGVVFLMLTRGLADGEPVPQDLFDRERRDLGPMSLAERRVAAVFLGTAGLWLGRTALDDWIPGLSDTGIALFGALLLFAWPMPRPEGSPRRAGDALGVLDWSATARLPWGVLLLFGGGLSLAAAIQTTGLASWIGGGLGALDALPIFWISLATVALVVILTELTSNTATTAAFLPVLAALGVGLGEDPLLLLVPATLAASCAFMLPVATPPNAIVYGSGRVTLPQMVGAGWRLNLVFIPLVTGLCYGLLTTLLGVQAGVLPPWATP